MDWADKKKKEEKAYDDRTGQDRIEVRSLTLGRCSVLHFCSLLIYFINVTT